MLNGFHETWPIVYPEDAYGFATHRPDDPAVPDGTTIRLFVDDDPFDLASARDPALRPLLDMRFGALDRAVE